jgi:hypothetical protein
MYKKAAALSLGEKAAGSSETSIFIYQAIHRHLSGEFIMHIAQSV